MGHGCTSESWAEVCIGGSRGGGQEQRVVVHYFGLLLEQEVKADASCVTSALTLSVCTCSNCPLCEANYGFAL